MGTASPRPVTIRWPERAALSIGGLVGLLLLFMESTDGPLSAAEWGRFLVMAAPTDLFLIAASWLVFRLLAFAFRG